MQKRSVVLAAGMLISVGLIAPGCASSSYRASRLPQELLAPLAVNTETIDLSGLAEHSADSDLVQPGDVLDVTMITDFTKLTTTTTPVRVGEDGTMIVPLVGRVGVAGVPLEQAEQTIGAESVARGIFRSPCVTITMKQRRTNKVMVIGAVNAPGPHELARASSSMLAALVAAGGLSQEAGLEVEIRHTATGRPLAGGPDFAPGQAAARPQGTVQLAGYAQRPDAPPPILKVNLAQAAAGTIELPRLEDGDVVYVAKRSLAPIYVQGLVQKPGEFVFPTHQELRLLDAIALAGGSCNPVADKVLVIRQLPGRAPPAKIAASIQNAMRGQDNLLLAPGDMVIVERTPATALVDTINTFFRVGFGATLPGL